MRESSAGMVALLACLCCAACLTGCGDGEAGTFEVVFEWVDPPPAEEAWVSARIEQRPGEDPAAWVTIAEAPIIPYTAGVSLSFGDLPYGHDYVVLVEFLTAADRNSRVTHHGVSEHFGLEAGRHTQVPVRLHLTETPGGDPDGAVQIVSPVPVDGVIGSTVVSLGLSVENATRVAVANDQAFSLGLAQAALTDLDRDGDLALWTGWDLDADLCAEPPCADGPRRVYVRFLDDEGYKSPIHSAQVVVDRQGPQVTGANLVRQPVFAPAQDDGLVWFASQDLVTGAPVQADLYVYANEPLAEGASLAATGPDGASLDFAPVPEESNLSAGIAVFQHTFDIESLATDGDYTFEVTWSDALGNPEIRDVPWTLRLHNAAPTGAIDLDATVYRRADWGDQDSAGLARFCLTGAVTDPATTDVAAVLALSQDDTSPGSQLGVVPVDDQGLFQATALPGRGVVRPFLAPVSRSGSLGATLGLRWVEFVATLGQENPGTDRPNPHSFVSWPIQPTSLRAQGNLVPTGHGHAELSAAGDGAATASGAAHYQLLTSSRFNPNLHAEHAAVYDSARGRMVLFGGFRLGTRVNETWEWDGANWEPIDTPNPPTPRAGHAMVYDSARQVTVMFGGEAGSPLDTTWEYDGSDWALLNPGTKPPARSGHAMVYDSARGRVVLFGGLSSEGEYLGDTWEFDGITWEQRQPALAPDARTDHMMSYDYRHGRVLLFGGLTDPANPQSNDELWEWDGQIWDRRCDGEPADDDCLHPNHPDLVPGGISSGAMAPNGDGWMTAIVSTDELWDLFIGDYWARRCAPGTDYTMPDVDAGMTLTQTGPMQLIMCGRGGPTMETWEYGGVRWTLHELANPPGGYWPAMAYHPGSGKLVVFGGLPPDAGASGETWEWDGTWHQQLPDHQPSGRYRHAMASDLARDTLVLFGGNTGGDETWEWDGNDWTQRFPDSDPGACSSHAMAYHPVRQRVVLYGAGAGDDETWEWDGDDWTQRFPAHSPGDRTAFAMAGDLARGEVVLFGGYSGGQESDETWVFDGGDWILRTPPVRPPAMTEHAMVYDPHSQRVLLFGGADENGEYSEATWVWDGQTWSELSPLVVPQARFTHTMGVHPERGRVVIFGGSYGQRDDTWTLENGAVGPGQIMAVDLQSLATGGQDSAFIAEIQARLWAGGTSDVDAGSVDVAGGPCTGASILCVPDYQTEPGAVLHAWLGGAWLPVATNQAPPDAPSLLDWTDSLPAHQLGDLLHLAITPAGVNGSGQAVVSTDYAEVIARVCYGGAECEGLEFPDWAGCPN